MDRKKIQDQLITIYKNFLDKEKYTELTLNTQLNELNINSVDFIKIIIEIENTFDFEFDDDALAPGTFQTIQDVYNYVICAIINDL